MKAAVFHGRGDVRIEDVPAPAPASGEVLLRVSVAGICGTDAHEYAHGPHLFPVEHPHPVTGHVGPLIPGHEFAGVIVDRAGDVAERDFPTGSLVVCGAGISCGRCHWCRRGQANLCENYSTVGLNRPGGLAEYVAVPANTCLAAGTYGLPADWAALAQPMSIAVHALRRGRLLSGEVAVVLGAGGIGAFLAHAAVHQGAHVVVADLSADRLAVVRGLGAQHVVEVGPDSVAETLAEQRLVASVIYEVSGSAAGLRDALTLAQPGTRLVLVGLQPRPAEIDLRDVSTREIELIGTNAHVLGRDLPESLRLLAARNEGWSDIAPVALSLADLVEQGLRPLAERGNPRIKTLIDPWAERTRATAN